MSINESPEMEERALPCCLHLRCKSMYYRPDERPGKLHVEDAMGYWCVKTHEPIGPDGELADHGRCQPGRGCHVPAPTLSTGG